MLARAKSRDYDFRIGARRRGIDRLGDDFYGRLDARPTGGAENDDRNAARSEILLVPKVPVRSDQHFEALPLGGSEQCTILERGPAQFIRREDGVPCQQVA